MNLRDLRYVVAVADHGHFGRAADACHVSQPTLSAQLKKLEEQLGIAVFDRRPREATVTDAGREIVARARAIIVAADDLVDAAQQLSDPLAGRLRIGAIHTLGPYLLPLIMPALRRELPNIEWLLIEDQTARLLTRLQAGKLDAALLALPVDDGALSVNPIFDEAFLVAMPEDHRLAEAEQLTMQDLESETLLLLEDGHCLRDQALAACAKHDHGPKERPDFRATSLETLRHMVAAGTGITLLPELAATPSAGIAYRRLVAPEPQRKIGLVARKNSTRTAALGAVALATATAVGQHQLKPKNIF